MARTTNGNLIGRAAQTEKTELAEANYQAWLAEQRQILIDRENSLLDQAVNMPGFYEFWATVPVFG